MHRVLRKAKETTIHGSLFLCALVSIATTAGIIWVLVSESATFFGHVSVREFISSTKWTPLLEPRHFGVLPLVCGTLLVAGGALAVAVPVGLCTAIYLSEYARPWFRQVAKPVLEVLAGVPDGRVRLFRPDVHHAERATAVVPADGSVQCGVGGCRRRDHDHSDGVLAVR